MASVLKSLRKTAGYTFLWWVIRSTTALVRLCGITCSRRVAHGAGKLAYHLDRPGRHRAIKHMQSAFPNWSSATCQQHCQLMYDHLAVSIVDWINVNRLTKNLDQHFTISAEDQQRLEQGIDATKGTIFITGHVGNWELLAVWLSQKGFQASGVARESYDSRISTLTTKMRADQGVTTVLRNAKGASIQLIKRLRKPGFLALLIDQDIKIPSVHVPFFHHLASTPRGAAELAMKGHYKVIAGFCQRAPNGSYRLSIDGPFELADTGDFETDVRTNTARFTQAIETAIRQYPAQWVWMHRRWHTPDSQTPQPSVSLANKKTSS